MANIMIPVASVKQQVKKDAKKFIYHIDGISVVATNYISAMIAFKLHCKNENS